jgi:CheY-like chemotaxis protein
MCPLKKRVTAKRKFNFLKNAEANKARLGDGFPPVVVFIDINMPRMNGFEFLDEFKKRRDENEGYDTVVFLMVTSSDNT